MKIIVCLSVIQPCQFVPTKLMIYYRPIKILFGPIFVYFYKPKPPEGNNSHIVFIKTIIIFKLENWKYFKLRFFKKRQMSTLCHQKDLWMIAILWQIRWFYPTWNWKNPYLSELSDQIQFKRTAGYVTSDIVSAFRNKFIDGHSQWWIGFSLFC